MDPATRPAGHLPVMVDRIVELQAPALQRPGTVAVDATLGLGGHAYALLTACPHARLIGLDRDAEALAISRERLGGFGDRVAFVEAVYDRLPDVLAELGVDRVDAVLFDLGVSSMQLDEHHRGFSYAHDAPLDMRMTQSGGPSAADVVNTYDARDLARVLRRYGDERFADRIASRIVATRATEPFDSTLRLAELVRDAIPAAARRTGGHPAKRTFQALRIEVNRELEVLTTALPAAISLLRRQGRVVVMSYHSGEDRIAKRVLAAGARADVPDDLPVIPADREPQLRLLTRGVERPSADEVAHNPRSASVRVRAAERVREAA